MADKERLVRFSLLGQDYSFYTGTSEEEMEKILGLVRTLVEEGVKGSKSGTIPVSKAAIMACLNIASRYFKLQQNFENYKKENEARASFLVDKIDAGLLDKKEDGSV